MGRRPTDDVPARTAKELLASLIMAAREDAAFRQRLIFILQLPDLQRESLIRTAVEEMRLKGESADARTAFAMLATEQGAAAALRLLQE